MISRYTRQEMGAVWTPERRMETWLPVELAASTPGPPRAWCRPRPPGLSRARRVHGGGGQRARADDRSRRRRVRRRDRRAVGPDGRWIHYGLTSSDVLDTALALQLRAAGEIVLAGAGAYREALIDRALEHRDTLCAGRTHGVHAEPTTFGVRLAGFAFEADRNLQEAGASLRGRPDRQAVRRGRHLRLGTALGRAPGDGGARPARRGRLNPGGAA